MPRLASRARKESSSLPTRERGLKPANMAERTVVSLVPRRLNRAA